MSTHAFIWSRFVGVLLVACVLAGCGAQRTTTAADVATSAPEPFVSPAGTMEALVAHAKAEKPVDDARKYLTERSRADLDRYAELFEDLSATNPYPNPLRLFLRQMRELDPTVEETREFPAIENGEAMLVRYNNGLGAVFLFERENDQWHLNLAEEIETALEIMESVYYRRKVLREAVEEGKPIPEGLFGDDD